jgi:hypothetical protein
MIEEIVQNKATNKDVLDVRDLVNKLNNRVKQVAILQNEVALSLSPIN